MGSLQIRHHRTQTLPDKELAGIRMQVVTLVGHGPCEFK